MIQLVKTLELFDGGEVSTKDKLSGVLIRRDDRVVKADKISYVTGVV